jgi:predicted  nucleic acid-binding Zn-ribbon protein
LLEQLELLLSIQKTDSELSDLLITGERLPRRVADLEGEKELITVRVAEMEQKLEDSRKDRHRFDRELEDLKAKLDDLQSKRLMIKTNEEYAALTHEIEFSSKEMSKTEDAALELLEELEGLSNEVEEARSAAEQELAEIDVRIGGLREELSRLEDAIAIKRDERLRLSKRIDPLTLARYDRILASKGDYAVVPVSGGACRGCYMKLPPQRMIEIKRADTLILCEGCGRILLWQRGDDG